MRWIKAAWHGGRHPEWPPLVISLPDMEMTLGPESLTVEHPKD